MAAWESGDLIAGLKNQGLDVAEDAAKVLVEAVLDWVSSSALESATKMDDILAGLIPAVKPYILEQLDKIDGQVG
jgi:hypothetical protein